MSKYLRITDVIKKLSVSRSAILQWSREGSFPKPIKLSPKVTIWDEEKIDEWVQSKPLIYDDKENR